MILINIYLLCNIILTFPFTRKGGEGGGKGDEESSSFKLTDAARWGEEGRRAGASVTFALSFLTLAKPSFAKKKQINRKVDNAIHWINLQPMDSEPLG